VDQTGADAATEHFFNRPILCGPNGSGCCYPKFQPTDFWIRNGVGTANQNFYQPTNQFVDRCCYPKKNYFYRPTDLWTKREPILITHRPIIPKTRGISSSVNDRLYHEHQLSPLAPYTTVHYVTSLFGLIPTRWANICVRSSDIEQCIKHNITHLPRCDFLPSIIIKLSPTFY
jgi:hypothetical protein